MGAEIATYPHYVILIGMKTHRPSDYACKRLIYASEGHLLAHPGVFVSSAPYP